MAEGCRGLAVSKFVGYLKGRSSTMLYASIKPAYGMPRLILAFYLQLCYNRRQIKANGGAEIDAYAGIGKA